VLSKRSQPGSAAGVIVGGPAGPGDALHTADYALRTLPMTLPNTLPPK
jgi:hypothetical protein